MEGLLEVDPPDYYPIIDKLFADKLQGALESFGAVVEEMRVRVVPKGQEINLFFYVEASRRSFQAYDIESIIQGILEKLCDEATSSFGDFYGVSFHIAGLEVKEVPRGSSRRGSISLTVEGPQGVKSALARVGKGLAIKLGEWGYQVTALTLNMEEDAVRLTVRPGQKLDRATEMSLSDRLKERAEAYLRSLLGVSYQVRVEILSEGKVEGDLSERDDVRELMKHLKNGPSR
ncbi:hypothetical protein [Thermococcus sp.]|uniref:hypothetical protein n=1 Tax=Thermococcus sp. TaxID=35749 RepID=UPI00261FEA9B|nr:hypothetical protein [Thermococcus sp.]